MSYLDSIYYHPQRGVGRQCFQSCLSVQKERVGVPHVTTVDLFKLVHLEPPPELFKRLHYVALTPISKREAGLRMKGLLVNLKFAHMLDVRRGTGC